MSSHKFGPLRKLHCSSCYLKLNRFPPCTVDPLRQSRIICFYLNGVWFYSIASHFAALSTFVLKGNPSCNLPSFCSVAGSWWKGSLFSFLNQVLPLASRLQSCQVLATGPSSTLLSIKTQKRIFDGVSEFCNINGLPSSQENQHIHFLSKLLRRPTDFSNSFRISAAICRKS